VKKKPKNKQFKKSIKTPKSEFRPHHLKKIPLIEKSKEPESSKQKKPVWRFGLIDFKDKWGWEKISAFDTIKQIQQKIKHLETMTWGEIENKTIKKGTQQSHFMPVDKICLDAQKRLQDINLDDLDVIYSLRVNGKKRIWGKRDNEILYIIWWDPKHTVKPVQKSHT
jgi:hypothetical protein